VIEETRKLILNKIEIFPKKFNGYPGIQKTLTQNGEIEDHDLVLTINKPTLLREYCQGTV
jgi:hypothetical protein